MVNVDEVTGGNKRSQSRLTKIHDRIVITGGSCSIQTKALFNLINHQPDLYVY